MLEGSFRDFVANAFIHNVLQSRHRSVGHARGGDALSVSTLSENDEICGSQAPTIRNVNPLFDFWQVLLQRIWSQKRICCTAMKKISAVD